MQKLTNNKRSLLRVLLSVYFVLLYLVIFSLSVPPADLPLCGLMFALAALGFFLARQESQVWRVVWIITLIVSILCGALEIIAGQHIARQRSKHDSSMRLAMPNHFTAAIAEWKSHPICVFENRPRRESWDSGTEVFPAPARGGRNPKTSFVPFRDLIPI
jgi:hypothetical protein